MRRNFYLQINNKIFKMKARNRSKALENFGNLVTATDITRKNPNRLNSSKKLVVRVK